MNNDKLRCAKCGAEHLHAGMRGWSWRTGIFGSGSIRITCLACGHCMRPGQAVLNGAQTKPEGIGSVVLGTLGWSAAVIALVFVVGALDH